MNVESLRKILVVGGGSSGWMTAAYLRKSFPNVEITVIEASDIPIIGVGESTNVTMHYFQRFLGIDERSFMRASNGAYKIAIRFENFNRLGAGFYHPFGAPSASANVNFRPNAQYVHPSYHLAERGHFSDRFSYSYQIDAGLYGQYLKLWSKQAGVGHIVDRITGATVDAEGCIASVETEKSGGLVADLYIDCSGFRSFLLEKTLAVPFHSINLELINDRAIAARVPYVSKADELRVYTKCTALSAGWVWNIPLWSRIGTGYVYCSSFLTPSEAESEYRKFLGEDRVKDLEFNHLDIKAGRHEKAWSGNCVAIGISYGFLEPLESTGLSLTQLSIVDLANALSGSGWASGGPLASSRETYNKRQAELFDTTKEFIMAHYVLTNREDTEYWNHIRHQVKIPAGLAEKLEYAKRGSYEPINKLPNKLYHQLNWNLILSGMEHFGRADPDDKIVTISHSQRHIDALVSRVYSERSDLPETDTGPVEETSQHPTWYPTW
ncbi:MAG TPA: tryptophan halogenase family protein [Rhizomicrobium sp.]|nr:tryptophan halogenase family protein [Rhizomicrobium sp.]